MEEFINFAIGNIGHVAPILVAGVAAFAIAFVKFERLFVTYSMPGREAFLEKIRTLVVADKNQEAVALCDQYKNKPVAMIVREGLIRSHLPEEMIVDGMNLVAGEMAERVGKLTGFLSMIANVSTLLGLFGTILGLIQSFKAVSFADPQQKAALLTQGISTAMNATVFGLGLAIPCMVLFSILMNKTNHMVGEFDQTVLTTTDILRQRGYGVDLSKNNAA